MATSSRLLSVDVVRGLTIAAMILVTDPGSYSAVYSQLSHSEWTGITATDVIFPLFLLLSGVSLSLAHAKHFAQGRTRGAMLLQAVRRSVALCVVGLVLNGFPEFHLHTLRLPGILQRIAVAYLFAAVIYVAITERVSQRTLMVTLGGVAMLILVGYWIAVRYVPVPGFGVGRFDSVGSLPAWLDRRVFTVPHLWLWGPTPGYVGSTYDPDGLLCTLTGVPSLLFGALAGELLQGAIGQMRKVQILAGAGVVLVALGWGFSPWLPICKKLGTSTFVLVSGGIALLVLSAFYFLIDVRRWRRGLMPALVFGTNSILAFAVSTVLTVLVSYWHVTSAAGRLTVRNWIYKGFFAPRFSPLHASLLYAVAVVGVNLVVLYPLYRKRWFLRL